MTASLDIRADRYFVCNQCGPYGMGYGTPTQPNCYGGDCASITGGPQGPFVQCQVRERLRDFYADGVQGGTPLCKYQRTDAQTMSGLFPPFQTYAVNYFGDNDIYRLRPYGGGILETTGSTCPTEGLVSLEESYGHYYQGFGALRASPERFGGSMQQKSPKFASVPMIPPVPGFKNAKTMNSVAWPGSQSVCTTKL